MRRQQAPAERRRTAGDLHDGEVNCPAEGIAADRGSYGVSQRRGSSRPAAWSSQAPTPVAKTYRAGTGEEAEGNIGNRVLPKSVIYCWTPSAT